MNSELEIKTGRIREMLDREKLGGVLLNAQHNFAWISGGRSNGIDQTRENGAGSVLITRQDKIYLIANNIEISRLLAEGVSAAAFEPIELSWQNEREPSKTYELLRSLVDGDIVSDIPLFPEIKPIEPLVAECRYELTEPELHRLRDLGRDAGIAIEKAVMLVSPGLSEIEIARVVRDNLAAYDLYPVITLVGADERLARFRHPVPTANAWNRTLLIAVCARRHGLIASLSRIICVGDVPSDLQRRTEATAHVNAALHSATIAGTTGSELYDVALRAYEAREFAYEINKHHQGGACGYRTRDWVAHPASTDVVRNHQAFAWNPSITGTKTEETGIVTDDGFEIVTSSAGFPKIRVAIEGREYFSPGILSISKGASA
jgi:antitoxin VapB